MTSMPMKPTNWKLYDKFIWHKHTSVFVRTKITTIYYFYLILKLREWESSEKLFFFRHFSFRSISNREQKEMLSNDVDSNCVFHKNFWKCIAVDVIKSVSYFQTLEIVSIEFKKFFCRLNAKWKRKYSRISVECFLWLAIKVVATVKERSRIFSWNS